MTKPNPKTRHSSKGRAKPKPQIVIREITRPQKQKESPSLFPQQQTSLGGRIGGFLGNAAQNLLMGVFGRGDYKINKNSLMGNNSAVPAFLSKQGAVVISHREFLTDIVSSVGFESQTYEINPGDPTTFPFLSAIAKNFEEYELLGLLFEFKSTSATAVSSTNTALGTVIMATQYNNHDAPFPDKRHMESAQFADSGAPSCSMLHPIECDPKQNPLGKYYIAPLGEVPAGSDSNMYNLGKFTIATAGMQASSTIGELWVTYHVALRKPLLPNDIVTPQLPESFVIYSDASGRNNSNPFGSAPTIAHSVINATVSGNHIDITGLTVGDLYRGYIVWTLTTANGDCTDDGALGSTGGDLQQELIVTPMSINGAPFRTDDPFNCIYTFLFVPTAEDARLTFDPPSSQYVGPDECMMAFAKWQINPLETAAARPPTSKAPRILAPSPPPSRANCPPKSTTKSSAPSLPPIKELPETTHSKTPMDEETFLGVLAALGFDDATADKMLKTKKRLDKI